MIGTRVRHASPTEAADAIAGFTVANDVSMRDWQYRSLEWLQGKTWEHATPVGPWLVTPDEVGGADPDLEIRCEVDGVVRQASRTSELVFSSADLVAYASEFVTLEPGDLLLTGTPAGVGHGMHPPTYLAPGQVVRTVIGHIGELAQRLPPREPLTAADGCRDSWRSSRQVGAAPGRYPLRGRLPTTTSVRKTSGPACAPCASCRAPTCATSPRRRGSAVGSCRPPSGAPSASRPTSCTRSPARSASTPTCSSASGSRASSCAPAPSTTASTRSSVTIPTRGTTCPNSVDDLPPALPVNLPNPERRRDFSDPQPRSSSRGARCATRWATRSTSCARLISAGSGDDVRRLIERLERDLTAAQVAPFVPAQPGRSRAACSSACARNGSTMRPRAVAQSGSDGAA